MSDIIIYNGILKDKELLNVSLFDRAVYYGDGCFETFCSYEGKFLRLEDHISRLHAAIDYLGMSTPIVSEKDIRAYILQLLEQKKLTDKNAFVRIQVWRNGERGFRSSDDTGNVIIEAHPNLNTSASYRLAKVDTRAIPNSALSRAYKLSNSLNYIQAAKEAKGKGSDAALMLTVQNNISETELANIFWSKGGVIYTPSIDCDILPGVTRSIVLSIMQDKYEVHEGAYTWEDLSEADCVWLTNSLKEIIPVKAIDEVLYDPQHNIIKDAQGLFEEYKSRNLH